MIERAMMIARDRPFSGSGGDSRGEVGESKGTVGVSSLKLASVAGVK